MLILAYLALAGMIICQIIVVVKMFQTAGAVQGIIGLICGLWAYIWGWMNSGKTGLKKIMLIWTVLIILYCILAAASGMMHFSGSYNVG
ncbi:MAG TPA: hypothetical protein VKA60_03065 [Blastocatellia bacterium]|nr:hypothetical protein [Blastocatellia bacterium]